jgi:PKD repeat protein
MMLRKITIAAIIISSIFMVKNAFNNAQRPPAGYSGAPGEQTCAATGCHTGVVQVGSPNLNFSFFPPQNPRPDFYTTNTAYVFTVNFPVPPQPAVAGFLVSAIDQNNNSAGRFEIISSTSTDTLSGNGRKYISHKNATSTSAWVFRWVAPPVYVGTVTFYCAALGGDGNTLATNDITYTDTIQFLPGGVSNVLEANFTISDTVVCRGDVVTFSNTSTGTITSHSWTFGNNSIPPTANTTGPHNVTYGAAGVKTIKLVVSDGVSSDSITKTITVYAVPNVDAGINRTICSGESVALTATGANSFVWSTSQTTASITVSPLATTLYSVTGTSNGCSAIDDVVVTVNQSPVVNLPQTVTLCVGNSVTLNAGNAGSTYLWSTQETTQTITVSTAATYSVTVTNANNCTATDATIVDVITSLNVNFPPVVEICDGASTTLDAGFPGATYQWSNNATTRTITVSVADMYAVTVTDQNGCTGTASTELIVNPEPVVSINDDIICNGDVVILDAQNAGAAFQWSNQATTQTITVSPSDDITYSVTVTNTFGCTATDNATITVEGIRANDATVCLGDSATLTALGGSDYVWSNGATTATIKVLVFDTTYFILTGTVTGSCGTEDTVYIYPVVAAIPAFIGLSDTFCSNAAPVLLENFVMPQGGTFSGTGVQGNTLLIENVLPGGPFNINYTYTNQFGCTAQVTEQFSVIVAATVSLNGLSTEYCTNESVVTLSGSPAGGNFYGAGTAGNLFVPYFAGAGVHYIGYEYTAGNGCVSVEVDTIIVHDVPQLVFYMQDLTFCENDDAVALSVVPSGGIFSGAGVTDTTFNPLDAGVGGPYLIQYTYTDSNNCTSQANNAVHVFDTPDLSLINLLPSYCINDGAIDLEGLPSGGTFSGNGVNNNQLFPLAAGVGIDTITYVYTNNHNCTNAISTVIAILDLPQVNFTGLDTAYCTNDAPAALTGVPSGGTFSGTGVQGTVFTPANASAGGPHAVTYTYSDVNGCTNTASKNVFVNVAPNVSLSGLDAQYCWEDNPVAITLLPEGGVLTGAGVGSGFFNPWNAGVGTHIIRYEFLSANGCFDYADLTVTVTNCSGIAGFEKNNLKVYPNPFSNNLMVRFESEGNISVTIKLTDVLGKEVFSSDYKTTWGENIFSIETHASILPGLYYLLIVTPESSGRVTVLKD